RAVFKRWPRAKALWTLGMVKVKPGKGLHASHRSFSGSSASSEAGAAPAANRNTIPDNPKWEDLMGPNQGPQNVNPVPVQVPRSNPPAVVQQAPVVQVQQVQQQVQNVPVIVRQQSVDSSISSLKSIKSFEIPEQFQQYLLSQFKDL
ncbi:MAG: hypothetical protein KGN38_11080, partial [Actinomycetales bacterium]|nr:hypothetical protein [Actinomycetales bacterium]